MNSEREKELLEKLKAAGKKDSVFKITLKLNDIILDERVFPAEKYSHETLSQTHTHFMMNDLVRIILKTYAEHDEKFNKENTKDAQMKKMWDELENKNKKGE